MCFTTWLVSTPLNSERVRVGWCVCVDTVGTVVGSSGGCGVGNASSCLRGCVGGDGKDGAGDGLVGTVVEVVVKGFVVFVVFVGGAGGCFLRCLRVVWAVAILCWLRWLCCWILMVVEVLCNWENSAVVPPSS